MKALNSAKYYEENWNRFMVDGKGNTYHRNLEALLDREMSIFGDSFDQDSISKIRVVYAKKIADEFEVQLRKQMALIQRVERGDSSLGYITETQEIRAKAEMRHWFEFNCYQLSVFRKKYE